jgi:hypothetical protein
MSYTIFSGIVKRIWLLILICAQIQLKAQFFDVTDDQLQVSIVNEATIYGDGVSFFDFNKDGWDDLTIADGAAEIRFFINNQGNFTEVDLGMTNAENALVIMTLWADYDNDGDEDLLVTRSNAPVQLWQNQGDLTFLEVASSAGIEMGDYFYWGAAFADYDHDGFLDLYISKYYHPTFNPGYEFRSLLYHNNGNGTFSDVSIQAGLDLPPRPCFQPVFLDYNHDGWEDIFLVIDRIAFTNELFENNGNGTFSNVTAATGVGQAICSMTGTADDFDNDLDEDIYVTNGPNGNLLLVNQDSTYYINQAADMGVVLNQVCWGSLWIDYDNNSWLDLFVSVTSPVLAPIGNQFFINNEGLGFTNATETIGIGDDPTQTYMVASGDINNDGYADFVTNNRPPYESRLWQNDGGENHFVGVTLEGVLANKNGIGSVIHCFSGGMHYYRQTRCGEDFTAQNSGKKIFGIGANTLADSLIINWNSGTVDKYYNLEVDQYYHFREGASFAVPFMPDAEALTICSGDSVLIDAGDFNSYMWNTGDTTRTIIVFAPGEYYVQVTDQFGNQFPSETVSIANGDIEILNITVEHPLCHGNASGAVDIVSAQNDLTVVWSDGYEGTIRQNLHAGEYHYFISNTTGCADSGVVLLVDPDPLAAFLSTISATCHGDTDGSVVVDVSGGTPPYIVEIEGDVFSGLGAGLYAVEITDSHECVLLDTAEVVSPPPLNMTISVTDALCHAENNGSATIDPSGGTPPYQITFGGALSDLYAGEYPVEVEDANGCLQDSSFSVGQPSLLTCEVVVSPQYENGPMGTASVLVAGGTGPYLIEWSGGTINGEYVSDLLAGEYNVLVTDEHFCTCAAEFLVDWISYVDENSPKGMVVFPNPADQRVTFSNETGITGDFRMMDITGKIIFHQLVSGSNMQLDVSGWESGLYFISWNNQVQPLLVQH